ncbi:hypothetical protein GW17_00018818 [Ensete ventricosum]|nr:hypothetical protein GW17_00018818 [Ensete ventricosum]
MAYFVVSGEVAIGDGDGCGTFDGVNKPIHAVGHGDMVDPDVARTVDGYAIAVAPGSEAVVVLGVPDHAAVAGLDVMDVEVVDDDIVHELDSDAGAAYDLDVGAPAIDRLVAVDDQLLGEADVHVVGEHDPERPVLDHTVAEGALLRVDEVVVGRIGDDVELPLLPAGGVAAEALGAPGQLLAVVDPVLVAPPAPVDRVPLDRATSAFFCQYSSKSAIWALEKAAEAKKRREKKNNVGLDSITQPPFLLFPSSSMILFASMQYQTGPELVRSVCNESDSQIDPGQIPRILVACPRMGTKHTSRGPKWRRLQAYAVRTFPPGCSPSAGNPSGSSSATDEGGLDEGSSPDIAPAERGPVSDGTGASEPSQGGLDETKGSGAEELSLPEKRDLDSRKNIASGIRIFPPGCGANKSTEEGHFQCASVSQAKNLDKESRKEDESGSSSRDLNAYGAAVESATIVSEFGEMERPSQSGKKVGDSQKRKVSEDPEQGAVDLKKQTPVREASEKNVSSVSAYDETLEAERKKRSLLKQQRQSGKKVGSNQKRKVTEDPDQGAIDIKIPTIEDGSSQSPGKTVIVLGVMAAQNCPWRNGRRSRVSKPRLGTRPKGKLETGSH